MSSHLWWILQHHSLSGRLTTIGGDGLVVATLTVKHSCDGVVQAVDHLHLVLLNLGIALFAAQLHQPAHI